MDNDSKLLFQFANSSFTRLKEIDLTNTKNQVEIEKNQQLKDIYRLIIDRIPQFILKNNREIPYLYFFYGSTLYYLNKDTENREAKESAIRLIKTAIQNTPPNQSYIEYEKELIDILVNEKKINEAITYCFHILQLFPNDKHYLQFTSEQLMRVNRKDEAIQLMKKIVSAYPFEFENYTNLGKLYLSQKMFDDALNLFMKSKDIEPKFPDNYKYIGKIMYLKNRKAVAGSNFKTAIARKMYNHQEFIKNIKTFGISSNKADFRDDEKNTLIFLFECYIDLIRCGEDFAKELKEIEQKIIIKNYLSQEKIELFKKRL